jgi:predicted phosphodiesterase
MRKALIWPDTHVPDEDPKAIELLYKVASDAGPFDEVVLLGDFADFFTMSSHSKVFSNHQEALSIQRKHFLIREVECVNERLDEIDNFFGDKTKKIYIAGNHEYRLQRYISDKAPELFGYLDCPALFGLKDRPRWKWVPYSPEQSYSILGSKLLARHEPVGPTAKLTAQRTSANVVFGHTHRIEESQVVGLDGKNYTAFSLGWLGNKRASSMNYVKNHWQWALGFGIVYVDPKTKFFYHIPVKILDNYTACFNGKIYKV